jgi:murein L,D-transpeptidase YafK
VAVDAMTDRGLFRTSIAAAGVAWAVAVSPALALEIVLDDVAADRIERQRAFVRGDLALSGAPDLQRLDERLAERGLARGRPIYIRIFKAESELELWMEGADKRFALLAAYPICHWHGTIGPKLKEGDKQSPEGFYSVGFPETRLVGRWRRAFNLGYPNQHDQLLQRTGSHILVHGGCSSVGCFAMTDAVQEEIYGLATAALAAGQGRFQVHVYPFRMTDANLARHADHPWAHTWADLRPAYDSFERTRVPPRVVLCGVRYQVADGVPGDAGGVEKRLPVLKPGQPADGAVDPTIVADSNGAWSAPSCAIEPPPEASSIITASTPARVPVAAPARPRASRVAGDLATPPARLTPPGEAGTKAAVRKPLRSAAPVGSRRGTAGGSGAGSTGSAVVAGSDGFGTAISGRRDRVPGGS